MSTFLSSVKKCPLFAHIEEPNLQPLLDCLGPMQRTYSKSEFIFMAGARVKYVGVVLSGSVNVVQEDYWGNRAILAHVETGDLFGEAFSCVETDSLPIGALATEDSELLLLDYKRIINTCPTACKFHTALIHDMVKILAQKNIMLTQKMEIVTRRTTRERLMAYLSLQAIRAGESRFVIPFDRQQLADYLSVERSAMSTELSKMQADGLIWTQRSEFELLD